MEYQFRGPFTAVVAGPSGSGKSCFVVTFLKNLNVCNTKFKKVIWCYDEWQPLYKDVNVDFHHGLPNMDVFDGKEAVLLIIDDLMRETNGSVVDIFTKGCHHRNLSVFFLTQNIFHQGRGQRDISLNAHYIILFKNPRDRAQIKYLARQICPENTKFMEEAYTDATSKPHGYLLVDLKQETPDLVRYRASIFDENGACSIYVPKKRFKYTSTDDFDIIQ